MSEAGFFQQKRTSPTSFALVLLLHVGVLGAVIMVKGPTFAPAEPPLIIKHIPNPTDPEPVPEPPRETRQTERITSVTPTIVLPPLPTPVQPLPPIPTPVDPTHTGMTISPPSQPVPVRDPVRRGASVDPRYADALQPPYPLSEQRAQRTGTVQLRVTIGTDGRVRAVERLSATSDAFWEVARRQALGRWRFRPATIDGRPVESTKVMTIQFRLADV